MNKDLILERLKKSKFRSSFTLKEKDISYINKKGIKENDTHSKMIKSKNLEKNIPSTNHSTKMTKTVGVIKGGSKFIKKTKRK